MDIFLKPAFLLLLLLYYRFLNVESYRLTIYDPFENTTTVVASPSKYDCVNRNETNFTRLLCQGQSDLLSINVTECVQLFHTSDCSDDPVVTMSLNSRSSECRSCECWRDIQSISGCFFPITAESVTPAVIQILDMEKFEVYNSNSYFMTSTSVSAEPPPPIHILAYMRSEPTHALDADTVVFTGEKKIAVYIHGYATSELGEAEEMKDALFTGTHDVDSVLLLDWRRWSLPSDNSSYKWPSSYKIVALNNLPTVAKRLRKFLERKIDNRIQLHFIGFSLGAHIAGTASRHCSNSCRNKIQRISAVDPAGPIFEYSLYGLYPIDTTNTIRVSDAPFIDVIHASTTLGMLNAAGHLDVYIEEVECYFPSCTHHKALDLYISSLTKCSLITCPGGLLVEEKGYYVCQTKYSSQLSSLGYLSSMYEGRGVHKVKLYYHGYFSKRSTGNCSTFMDIRRPAKHRICARPPNEQSNCLNKPYLSTCGVACDIGTGSRVVECAPNGVSLRNTVATQTYSASALGPEDMDWNASGGGLDCPIRVEPVSCRLGDGTPVPFYIAYKIPRSLSYWLVYQDSNGLFTTKRKLNIDDDDSVLGIRR